jgi:hypothetical protein
MTRQREREEFVALMAQEGVPFSTSRLLMRYAATLHRLAEAQCNGDWPADNGERRVEECQSCQAMWIPSVLKRTATFAKACPDCRTGIKVAVVCEPYGIKPVFNGDPRGAVLKLQVPSGRTNDWGKEGICVP